jgi:hypothetical protein
MLMLIQKPHLLASSEKAHKYWEVEDTKNFQHFKFLLENLYLIFGNKYH